MQLDNGKPLSLSLHQRNLYQYYLNHKRKHPHLPCFVPRTPMQSSKKDQYLKAAESLENKGLIRIDRRAPNYTAWIILDPLPKAN